MYEIVGSFDQTFGACAGEVSAPTAPGWVPSTTTFTLVVLSTMLSERAFTVTVFVPSEL